MDLTDPAPEDPWPPQQFWECPQCNRHFWTTYPAVKPPAAPKPKPAPAPAAAAATPAVPDKSSTTAAPAGAAAEKPDAAE